MYPRINLQIIKFKIKIQTPDMKKWVWYLSWFSASVWLWNYITFKQN